MSTINELNEEIRTWQNENNTYKEQLTKLLLKRSTEQQLDSDQKQELADDIKSVRTTISENKQLILQNKKLITAQTVEKEKRDTLDKQLQNNLELSRNQGKSAASIDSL